jgi:hypothetical protein
MNRWSLAFVMIGTVLAGGVWAQAPSPGSDRSGGESQPGAGSPGENGATDPAQRIDKAIQAYECRADQELSQTRTEIARLRKELNEYSELQYDLAISLAELQAVLRVQSALGNGADGDGTPAGPATASPTATQERQRLRTLELARELRQVQENLRSLVQQKKGETDQLVAQLRNLRTQQRQTSSREGQPQPARPSRDD